MKKALTIYSRHTSVPFTVTGPVLRGHMPLDWNTGPGPEEYYPRGFQQASAVQRLLMYGESSDLGAYIDIPRGDVNGIGRPFPAAPMQLGLIPVGLDSAGFTRSPSHQ